MGECIIPAFESGSRTGISAVKKRPFPPAPARKNEKKHGGLYIHAPPVSNPLRDQHSSSGRTRPGTGPFTQTGGGTVRRVCLNRKFPWEYEEERKMRLPL